MARDDRRRQLLDVAQHLFSHEGFHHVSMDDIADRAEVSKPVLYRHFPSKLDLYLAVIDRRGESLVAAIDQALASVDGVDDGEPPRGREVVRAIVRAHVEFVQDAGESFSLLFESDVTRNADVRAHVERASAAAAQAVSGGLHELAGLPTEQAELAAAALVGMTQVAATSRYRSQAVTVDDTVELATQLAWRGVAGLVKEHTDAVRGAGPHA